VPGSSRTHSSTYYVGRLLHPPGFLAVYLQECRAPPRDGVSGQHTGILAGTATALAGMTAAFITATPRRSATMVRRRRPAVPPRSPRNTGGWRVRTRSSRTAPCSESTSAPRRPGPGRRAQRRPARRHTPGSRRAAGSGPRAAARRRAAGTGRGRRARSRRRRCCRAPPAAPRSLRTGPAGGSRPPAARRSPSVVRSNRRRISMFAPSRVPIVTAPLRAGFMLPGPEASMPASEICSEWSAAA
jgi:hypothetical protein